MRIHIYLLAIFIALLTVSCKEEYLPKPRGYFRIDFQEKAYKEYNEFCPYKFEYPENCYVVDYIKDSCWINIIYPQHRAIIYLTYKHVGENLDEYLEQSRGMAYKHSIKADAINEYLFPFPEKKVYGILYEIKGNSASSVNFYVTDSTNHFLRGALYFNVRPNWDSLSPVIDYITEDVAHVIETIEWKDAD